MSSNIVRTVDIASLISKAEEIVAVAGGELKYVNRPLIAAVQAHPRIQYFYYCDDREGVTIRLFDREIVSAYPNLSARKSKVFFRVKRVGEEGEPLKTQLRQLWDEVLPRPTGIAPQLSMTQSAILKSSMVWSLRLPHLTYHSLPSSKSSFRSSRRSEIARHTESTLCFGL